MQIDLFNKMLNNFYSALPIKTYFCENLLKLKVNL